MADKDEANDVPKPSETPLVFISHDTRDAELAEAFSKLLRSVSAGMLKSFRSSDKTGKEGIEFGDEWFKTLMTRLGQASDVVCLLTERSLERPWLLYEAGVAKGKLDTPVQGLALGVPLASVSTGPFYQFQNSDDSEDALSKLVRQLCQRVPSLEPDDGVVRDQVKLFKATSAEVLKKLGSAKKAEKSPSTEEDAVAKVLEEMKIIVREIPARIEHAAFERGVVSSPGRPRTIRYRDVFEFAQFASVHSGDPTAILILASLVRDDMPWIYEIGMEAYRTARQGKPEATFDALRKFQDIVDLTIHGPLQEELFGMDKEKRRLLRELPEFINHILRTAVDLRPAPRIRKRTPPT